MTDSAAGRGARRPRSSRRTAVLGSAGMPTMAGDERMTELEARLDRLEGGPGMRDRGRALVRKVMPAEASHHFRNAMREQLLGFKSIVDFWIERVDEMEAKADDDDRMRIEVE
ncbi:MAG TPA: hypothetical protein VJ506_01860 [Candidatus Limnocylindrales bacterium]|nr:hypothetical protein [Candidatus Limnocylindrales bacterium]